MHCKYSQIASLPLVEIKRLARWQIEEAIAACPKCFREGLYKFLSA